MTDEQKKAQISALLAEREGYERYGKTDRVKQVDAALKDLGHKAKSPAQRSEKL